MHAVKTLTAQTSADTYMQMCRHVLSHMNIRIDESPTANSVLSVASHMRCQVGLHVLEGR